MYILALKSMTLWWNWLQETSPCPTYLTTGALCADVALLLIGFSEQNCRELFNTFPVFQSDGSVVFSVNPGLLKPSFACCSDSRFRQQLQSLNFRGCIRCQWCGSYPTFSWKKAACCASNGLPCRTSRNYCFANKPSPKLCCDQHNYSSWKLSTFGTKFFVWKSVMPLQILWINSMAIECGLYCTLRWFKVLFQIFQQGLRLQNSGNKWILKLLKQRLFQHRVLQYWHPPHLLISVVRCSSSWCQIGAVIVLCNTRFFQRC